MHHRSHDQGGFCPGGICPGGFLSGEVSVQGGLCPGGSLIGRPPGQRPLLPYGNELAVRILLECILVKLFLEIPEKFLITPSIPSLITSPGTTTFPTHSPLIHFDTQQALGLTLPRSCKPALHHEQSDSKSSLIQIRFLEKLMRSQYSCAPIVET